MGSLPMQPLMPIQSNPIQSFHPQGLKIGTDWRVLKDFCRKVAYVNYVDVKNDQGCVVLLRRGGDPAAGRDGMMALHCWRRSAAALAHC